LFLNATKITDAGIVHLAGLRELEELQLSGTAVTAKGLEPLKGLSGIRRFSFGKSPADATREMAEAARIFPEVTSLIPAPETAGRTSKRSR